MKPATNEARAKAIEYLGAVEIAPSRYAFSDGFTGHGDGKQWFFVAAKGLALVPRRGYQFWRDEWAKRAPSWWSPEQRFRGWVPYDGPHAYESAEQARFHGCAVVETADLTTGEEVPA